MQNGIGKLRVLVKIMWIFVGILLIYLLIHVYRELF
ncbi:hypothetical protein CLTHE_05480 [Clostridium thermobutyricum DSM 4928]|uniref:Uncharacterized protein n=1 Tax=Clostridium thermobutyricum DSM 4928 TaxID=1121339 RepID=A0A1V4SXX1_9CLOT|nr:hypothetical protein CLTHE_05480 [Clostridium thermobutyricum DSM 4928]